MVQIATSISTEANLSTILKKKRRRKINLILRELIEYGSKDM